jgi:hypothetical protein
MDIALYTTTGKQDLDDLLHGLVILFETVFPSRIRSYYCWSADIGHGREGGEKPGR